MTPRRRRMALVGLIVLGMAGAVALAVNAFNDNLLYFYTPSDLVAGKAPADRVFRVGGLVTKGSFKREAGSMEARFQVTDMKQNVTISYSGLLPDLFREGQGIIARGRMGENGTFVAEEVLAKHDENYMPPDVAKALAKQHGKDAPMAAPSAAPAGGEGE